MRKIMFALSLVAVLIFSTASVYADYINLPVKWSQLPDMDIGTDHLSEHPGPIVADDFQSDNPFPVVAVRWWGSYLTSDGAPPQGYTPPAGFAVPFDISFHFDIPDPNPADPLTWSQPDDLISLQTVYAQEEYIGDVVINDATGVIYREQVFRYDAYLTEPFDQEFYKDKNPYVQPYWDIFWIDIDRLDDTLDWGWHEALTQNIDDAVTGPGHAGPWTPIFKTFDPDVSADMAFELMVIPEPGSLLLLGSGLLGLIGYARKRFTA